MTYTTKMMEVNNRWNVWELRMENAPMLLVANCLMLCQWNWLFRRAEMYLKRAHNIDHFIRTTRIVWVKSCILGNRSYILFNR